MKIFPLLSIAFFFLLPLSSSAALYRWVDAQGNVSYSDKIPPAAAKHGHVELNYSGVKKKTALSAEQKKAIKDMKIQQRKERKEQRERAEKLAIKKMQDEQLLSIYSNKNELINVYEGKIEMSSTSIVLLKKRHKVLSDRLAKTEIKHEKMKNPRFKETLEKKIDDMLDGLKVYQQAITENMVEKNKLEKQYVINLKRFNNLTKEKTLLEEVVSKIDKPLDEKSDKTTEETKAAEKVISKLAERRALALKGKTKKSKKGVEDKLALAEAVKKEDKTE